MHHFVYKVQMSFLPLIKSSEFYEKDSVVSMNDKIYQDGYKSFFSGHSSYSSCACWIVTIFCLNYFKGRLNENFFSLKFIGHSINCHKNVFQDDSRKNQGQTRTLDFWSKIFAHVLLYVCKSEMKPKMAKKSTFMDNPPSKVVSL